MKNVAFILVLFLFFAHSYCLSAENSEIIFCETFDDQWKPIKQGKELKGPAISWIATANKTYGIPQLCVSIYRHEGDRETLVERRTIEVNPEWDTTGMRNMLLPSDGKYTISITTPVGETLNKGQLTYIKAAASTEVPKEETLGAKLEALFKKYSPKK